MTPDGTRLVVSNMCSGFDIYDAETGLPIASLTHAVNQVHAVPVRFIHGGHAVLGGSTVGEAHIWDVTGVRMHPPLIVGGAFSEERFHLTRAYQACREQRGVGYRRPLRQVA